jgi:NADPH2:quinone reductase
MASGSDRTTDALVVTRHGGTDVLAVQRRPVDGPDEGEVLVRVAAVGVNFIDVYQREGRYPIPTPFVLCTEGAGHVEAVGDGVRGISVGQAVAWPQFRGSAAGLVSLPADMLVPVPESVGLDTAAAVMLQGITAHYLLNSTYAVQPGDPILVHAAAGGVGQLLTQLAKGKGAVVIGTVGSADKARRAAELGADHVINYTEDPEIAASVRRLTGGDGVPVVYDGVGQATFEQSLLALRIRGLLALFGAASGPVPPFDLQRLNAAGSLFVTRPTLVHYLRTREEFLWRSRGVLDAVAAGTVQVHIGGRYRLHEAARAYNDLEARRTMGKLLLIP